MLKARKHHALMAFSETPRQIRLSVCSASGKDSAGIPWWPKTLLITLMCSWEELGGRPNLKPPERFPWLHPWVHSYAPPRWRWELFGMATEMTWWIRSTVHTPRNSASRARKLLYKECDCPTWASRILRIHWYTRQKYLLITFRTLPFIIF